MRFKKISESVVEFVISRDLKELSGLTRYKIADHFGINKNYLSEKFKEDTQMTVLEFLNFEKMKRAECLLKKRRDIPVKRISLLVGIAKVSQFRSKFRNVYGLKPGRYREVLKR